MLASQEMTSLSGKWKQCLWTCFHLIYLFWCLNNSIDISWMCVCVCESEVYVYSFLCPKLLIRMSPKKFTHKQLSFQRIRVKKFFSHPLSGTMHRRWRPVSKDSRPDIDLVLKANNVTVSIGPMHLGPWCQHFIKLCVVFMCLQIIDSLDISILFPFQWDTNYISRWFLHEYIRTLSFPLC